MFGIIMGLISTGCAMIDGIKRGYESAQGYNRGLQRKANGSDNTNTYFDWRGACRDLDTGELRFVDPILNESYGQDQCIRDVRGNVVRNLSEERRQAKFDEAKKKGDRTVVLYDKNGIVIRAAKSQNIKDYCEGPQFKDLANGSMYVARRFKLKDLKKGDEIDAGYVTFYMNFDGLLVREADSVTKKREQGVNVPSVEEVTAFINKFNTKQGCENGWYNCKDKIYHRDSFGNLDYINFYNASQFYCSENIVFNDV